MKHRSSLYPTNRDVILKSAERWMSAKRKDDNVGKNLWRVHDKLYDLTEFANRVRHFITYNYQLSIKTTINLLEYRILF